MNELKKIIEKYQELDFLLENDKNKYYSINDNIKTKELNLFQKLIIISTKYNEILFFIQNNIHFFKNDIDHKNDKKMTSLMIACCIPNINIKLFELILENTINVNELSINKYNALSYAISEKSDINLIKLLINHNIDINVEHLNKTSPLILSCIRNDYNIIKLLIQNGADVNKQCRYGFTALMECCLKNNYKSMKLLLKSNADISLKNYMGYDIFMYSCVISHGKHDVNIKKMLLEYGSDINTTDLKKNTPLMLICKSSCRVTYETVKFLLENKCKVNLKNKNNATALLFSCRYLKSDEDIKKIKILLEYGADIDCVDDYYNTPISNIIITNSGEFFKKGISLLLDYNPKLELIKNYTFHYMLYENNISDIMYCKDTINWKIINKYVHQKFNTKDYIKITKFMMGRYFIDK